MSPLQKKEEKEKLEAEKKKEFEAKRKIALDDLRWVLSTKQGRRFLWSVLSTTGLYHESFDPSGSITNFKLGKRNIGLWLLEEIHEADQEAYFVMRREHKGEK